MAARSDEQARTCEAGRAALNDAGHADTRAQAIRRARLGAQRRTAVAAAESANHRRRDPPGQMLSVAKAESASVATTSHGHSSWDTCISRRCAQLVCLILQWPT